MRKTWALALGGIALAVTVPTSVAVAGTLGGSTPTPPPVGSGYSAGPGYGGGLARIGSQDCPAGLTDAEREQMQAARRAEMQSTREQRETQMQQGHAWQWGVAS